MQALLLLQGLRAPGSAQRKPCPEHPWTRTCSSSATSLCSDVRRCIPAGPKAAARVFTLDWSWPPNWRLDPRVQTLPWGPAESAAAVVSRSELSRSQSMASVLRDMGCKVLGKQCGFGGMEGGNIEVESHRSFATKDIAVSR